jgi:hypothetical protein
MMSLAVSSSSALVISAPGTIMAIGAHTANNGTCVSPAPWASAPTNVVAVSVATKGTIATAPWIRLSTVVITPTSAPTTAVTTMAHQEHRNRMARPLDSRALPTIHCRPACARTKPRICVTCVGTSDRDVTPAWTCRTSWLAWAACRNDRSDVVAVTTVAAPVRVCVTMTISGSTENDRSSPSIADESRTVSSDVRTSVTERPASRRSAPSSPRISVARLSSGRRPPGATLTAAPHPRAKPIHDRSLTAACRRPWTNCIDNW